MRSLFPLIFLLALLQHEEICNEYGQMHQEPGTRLVLLKGNKVLCFFKKNELVFSSVVSYGSRVGKKKYLFDRKTPEGVYSVGMPRASSRHGTFLLISYPNAADTANAEKSGLKPGNSVGIHGPAAIYEYLGSFQALMNHSEGCVVLHREAIDRLSSLMSKPVLITILPVEMSLEVTPQLPRQVMMMFNLGISLPFNGPLNIDLLSFLLTFLPETSLHVSNM